MPSLIGVEDVVFDERFNDRPTGGGVARRSGVSGVRCLLRPGYQRSAFAGRLSLTQQLTFGSLFNNGLGEAGCPGTLQLIVLWTTISIAPLTNH